MRFCCKIESFTKSAQFWSQNVSLGLIKKRVPTLYASDHKQRSYSSLKLPNHASFSPLLHKVFFHKQTVHSSSSHMSISAWLFLQCSGKPGHGIVPVNIKNYCLGNSSVTHVIIKNRELLQI